MGLFFFGVLLFISSLFMMLLILVQRGKGGGLTGALGGMGGQSAFGAKAGDAFTRITTITAIIWITLSMLTIALFNPPPQKLSEAEKDKLEAVESAAIDQTEESAAGPLETETDTGPEVDLTIQEEIEEPTTAEPSETNSNDESSTENSSNETGDGDNGSPNEDSSSDG